MAQRSSSAGWSALQSSAPSCSRLQVASVRRIMASQPPGLARSSSAWASYCCLFGFRQWQGRSQEGEEVPTPKWMGALETFTPVKAFGAGGLMSGVNPKNLLLTIAGASTIAQTGISAGQQAIVYAIFMVIATIGVGAPVVLYFALGSRSRQLLDRLKRWMAQNNAAILAVLFLVFGVKLVGDAISGFSV